MTYCGTGLGNFPKPGDPDLNGSILSASARFNGIQVSWTYPGLLPQAVAHTRLYRSLSSNFATAVLHRIVSGNSYFDEIETEAEITYYYWIEIVSVNGTIGNLIGPASATLNSMGDWITDLLEGLVTDSLLDADLRSRIDSILGFESGLQAEIQDRIYGDGVLDALLASMQGDMDDIDTLIASEVVERITADSALVASINLIQAQVHDNAAAVINESIVRANADEAIAATVTTLTTAVEDNTSAVVTESLARISADEGLAAEITSLTTTVGENTADISLEAVARADADSAIVTTLDNLQITVNSNASTAAAAVLAERTARINADGVNASAINTVQSNLNGVSSTVATNHSTMVSTTGTINSKYTVKIDNNGYVTGYGLMSTANNAAPTSEFEVRADKFFIASPSGPGIAPVTPFAVLTSTDSKGNPPGMYVEKAFIKNADITTLKLAGEAVTVPVSNLASSFLSWIGLGSTVVSVPITISGLQAGETAGITGVGNISIYPKTAPAIELRVILNINGVLQGFGAAMTNDGHGINLTAIGKAQLGNGTHTASLMIIADPPGNFAYDAGIVVIGSKR